jgi:hypothetical protein
MWENLVIDFILGVLAEVVKNPAKQATLQAQLLNVAQQIANMYGYTLSPPSAATGAAKTK